MTAASVKASRECYIGVAMRENAGPDDSAFVTLNPTEGEFKGGIRVYVKAPTGFVEFLATILQVAFVKNKAGKIQLRGKAAMSTIVTVPGEWVSGVKRSTAGVQFRELDLIENDRWKVVSTEAIERVQARGVGRPEVVEFFNDLLASKGIAPVTVTAATPVVSSDEEPC